MKFKISEDKAKLEVVESFTYKWKHDGVRYAIRVPKGFRFRIGIPLRLGSLGLIDIFAPTFSLLKASAAHDRAYYLNDIGELNISREVADEIMRSDENDPKWIKNVAYYLVRAFGWIVW